MYMMFIYKDKKIVNSMGIRGSLLELSEQLINISNEIFKSNPRSEVTTKITMYI